MLDSTLHVDVVVADAKARIRVSFGVGYDNIDVKYAVEHGITVTNTPEVLNEEVADTALGLLLCTVREFPQARTSCAPANGWSGNIR